MVAMATGAAAAAAAARASSTSSQKFILTFRRRLGSALGNFPPPSAAALSRSRVRRGRKVQDGPWRSGAGQVVASSTATATPSAHARVGADASASTISAQELMEASEAAAKRGAQVVLAAVDKPRQITYKGATDLVTDTDRATEEAVLEEIRLRYPGHLILGEEGGVSGDASSEYLWCVDPLDGTTNFAHGYPSFATSVGVLFRGRPIAACVVEFAGGPHCWVTRTFTAAAGGGAFCDGEPISVSQTATLGRSLLVTGFGYEHDDAWAANIELFKHFTDVSRGVRRLGAAAVDMCHVAFGIADAYWEYRLKPWDMAAGVLMVEEAGGAVSRMDGEPFTVFERSVLVSNGALHSQLLEEIGAATRDLKAKELFEDAQWFKPANYTSDV